MKSAQMKKLPLDFILTRFPSQHQVFLLIPRECTSLQETTHSPFRVRRLNFSGCFWSSRRGLLGGTKTRTFRSPWNIILQDSLFLKTCTACNGESIFVFHFFQKLHKSVDNGIGHPHGRSDRDLAAVKGRASLPNTLSPTMYVSGRRTPSSRGSSPKPPASPLSSKKKR